MLSLSLHLMRDIYKIFKSSANGEEYSDIHSGTKSSLAMLFSFGQAVSTSEIAGVVGILITEFICLLRVSYCFIRSITCPKCFFESTLERVSISEEILS
jgi:hypothetical protein